jgi:hypothetical protein
MSVQCIKYIPVQYIIIQKKIEPYPDLPGCGGCGRGHHDEHVVERLQLDVVPEQAPHHGHGPLKLHLVLQLPRPRGGEPLLVLTTSLKTSTCNPILLDHSQNWLLQN